MDCDKRNVGCHGKCEEYKEYQDLMKGVRKSRSDDYKRSYDYKVVHWEEENENK